MDSDSSSGVRITPAAIKELGLWTDEFRRLATQAAVESALAGDALIDRNCVREAVRTLANWPESPEMQDERTSRVA
jgi:hypothetical protein